MNEQQLADLFSTQIDRLLGGETVSPPGELADLLGLGQHLAGTNFQPSLAAQATFQGQLTHWFGSTGGALPSATIVGLPKGVVMAVSALVIAVGAGLGLMALLGTIGVGLLFNTDSLPTPTVTIPTAPVTVPISITPTVPVSPALTTPTPAPLPESVPVPTSSVGDTLPATPLPLSDTVPLPSVTPTLTLSPTSEITDNEGDGADTPSSTDEPENVPPVMDDHDRGHGNDADGVDEDNPGQSSGHENQAGEGDKGGGKGGDKGN